MPIDLFDACGAAGGGDDDSADLSKIEINKEFARRLEHNKRREALQRYEELKKQGRIPGSDDDSDESSDESSGEDEDHAGWRKKSRSFVNVLAKVKRNDPEIHRKDAKLYLSEEEDDAEEDAKPRTARKERPLYLKDVMARHLIEEGPEFGEKRTRYDPKVYDEEQKAGLEAFLEAEKEAMVSDGEGDVIKEKERIAEDVKDDEDAREVKHHLDIFFGKDEDLDENERFLKGYLRDMQWIDKDKGKKKPLLDEICGVSEDEDELDKQDKYEAEYNFRHEEEMADRVMGHSRHVEGSVRKKASSRKQQRKSKEERMALAELERKEELKHLKNLKKREIQERLEKIREIAGIRDSVDCRLGADDLEEDFDPQEYDRKMKEVFDGDYYEAEDADPVFGSDEEGDLGKPDFNKEDELLGLPKGWDVCGSSSESFAAARERFLHHKEEEGELQNEDGKRKRKRKISLKEKVELDKELEEYYKLDYEDTIGDLKTRFKYKSVGANRFGLQPEEILVANDRDLNQYVSLKKIAPYREKEWKVTYHQKLKKDLILQGGEAIGKNGKRLKLTARGPSSMAPENGAEKPKEEEEEKEEELRIKGKSTRSQRRRRRQAELKLSHSRLIAYGKIPKLQKKH